MPLNKRRKVFKISLWEIQKPKNFFYSILISLSTDNMSKDEWRKKLVISMNTTQIDKPWFGEIAHFIFSPIQQNWPSFFWTCKLRFMRLSPQSLTQLNSKKTNVKRKTIILPLEKVRTLVEKLKNLTKHCWSMEDKAFSFCQAKLEYSCLSLTFPRIVIHFPFNVKSTDCWRLWAWK